MINAFETTAEWLMQNTNVYVVVILFVLCYYVFDLWMKKLSKKQKMKKKIVKQKIHDLKEPYRQKSEIIEEREKTKQKTMDFFAKWDNFAGDKSKWRQAKEALGNAVANQKMIEALRFEKLLAEDELENVQTESRQIIKEEKHKALLSLFYFVFRIIVFVVLIGYFHTIKEIPNSIALVYVTVILSFFSYVTRKTVGIFLIIAIISYFIYQELSGASLAFILLSSVLSGTTMRLERKKKTKEKGE